VVIES